MFGKRKYSLLSLALLLALLAAAVMPFSVLAEDETPPPADPPVVEEVPPAEDLTVPEVLEQLPADTTLVVLDQSGEALPLTAEEAAAVVVTGDPIWCPTGVDPIPGTGGCTDAQFSLSELITVLQTQTDGLNFDYAGAGTIYIAAEYDASTDTSLDYGTDIFFTNSSESPFQIGLTDLVVQGGWGGAPGSSSDLSGINSLNFWYWGETPLSLTLNNIILDGAGWNGELPCESGLCVDGNYGNVELNGVSVTNSYNDGARIYVESNGDVTINESNFSSNGHVETYSVPPYTAPDNSYSYSYTEQYAYGNGLNVRTGGNVTLDNVSANDNHRNGALVGTEEGSMAITNSQFDSNGSTNSFSGSYSEPGYQWYEYENERGEGSGLVLRQWGEGTGVTLNNVSASGNYGGGAGIFTDGTVAITNSQFDSNGSTNSYSAYGWNIWNGNWFENQVGAGGERGVSGLNVRAYAGATLNSVSASGNRGDGAGIDTYGTLAITDSQFNSNGSTGFYEWYYETGDYAGSYYESYDTGVGAYLSGNAITLTKVTASDNLLDGVVLGARGGEAAMAAFAEGAMPEEGGVMATIMCSTFENNGGYGVYSYLPGTLALNGVTFNGNEGDYYHEGAVTFGPCQPVADEGSDEKGQTPEPLYFVIEQLQSQLPGTLGNGLTFGSAFKVELTGAGEKAPELAITLAFPIPDGMQDADLGVMFWNGSAWVEVPGGGVVDGKFVITVDQPGFYVLVSK